MIFGRSNQPDHHRVYIDNIVIERVNCNKFLGVIIDSKLSWSDHVSYIRHKMSKNLSVMYRVKWLLNNSALYMIYCTLVLPYISYCCEIWGNTYTTRVQPLYIIQKRAILWSAVAQLVECRTRNREIPGSNPRCYRFEVWAFSFTSRRLSCINEYLAIDSGGNVSE